MKRILIIRGGALGDFILTLPAVKLLRDAYPAAHLELLGNVRFLALAENRFYANAIRSLDSADFASFFARDAPLPAKLGGYFASFDLIISYLFDPERIFEANVARCSAARFLTGSPKFHEAENAARQLARPLESLGLELRETSAHLFFPDDANREILSGTIALHPGSGSRRKNWPIENWVELGDRLLEEGRSLLVVGGEADREEIATLRARWEKQPVRFAIDWPLPELAAWLAGSTFAGHDSGVSHLAAAAGARCFLLFGPTDPKVWAPTNPHVQILPMAEANAADLAAAILQAPTN